jgi:hypothetical protein
MPDDSEKPSQSSLPGTPAAGSRIVSKITESVQGYSYINEFTFDENNRLIGIEQADAVSVSISYKTGTPEEGIYKNSAPYSVIVKYQDRSDPAGIYGWTGIYTSDDTGYLTSGNMVYNYCDGSNRQRTWNGIHNSKGCLTNSTWNEEGSISLYDITWTDGNMTRISSGEGEVVTDYEYSDIVNNPLCNLDLNYLVTCDWIDSFTAIIGLLGKRSANMIGKETETYSYPYSSTFTTTYAYETDSKGFVTKITQTRRQSDSTHSNIFTRTSVYEITYR